MDNFIIGQIFADVSAHADVGSGKIDRAESVEKLGAEGCTIRNGKGSWIEMSKVDDPKYNYHIIVFGARKRGGVFVEHIDLADPNSIDNLKALAKETLCHRTELPSE
jgi:hypothetical protein